MEEDKKVVTLTLEFKPGEPVENLAGQDPTSISECIRANIKALAYCCGLSVGPIVYGFDIIIVALVTAMPAFQTRFGELHDGHYILPALWLSLWTSMISVGVMIGALVNNPVSERFGRRPSVAIGSLISIAGALICYFSDALDILVHRRVLFLVGKTVIGLGLGMLLPASQTYVSEVAPTRLRGPLLSLFTLFVVIGQVIAIAGLKVRILMPSAMSYKILFAAEIAPSGLCIILAFIAPESPVFLVKRGEIAKAVKAFTRLYPAENPQAGVAAINADLDREKGIQGSDASWIDCFRGTNWRRTRINFYANIVQQFVGIAMIVNATYFMQLGGLSPANSITVTTISLCLSMIGLVVSWYTMTRFGRRIIILGSTGAIGMTWFGIGIAGCFKTSTAFWAVGYLLVVVQFLYGFGVGSSYPVIASEVSTIRLRDKTQSLGFFVQFLFNWGFNYAVPYMYSADEGDLGGKVGFIFGTLSVIAFAVMWVEIPEMKDLTYAQLDLLFEHRAATRKFQRTLL